MRNKRSFSNKGPTAWEEFSKIPDGTIVEIQFTYIKKVGVYRIHKRGPNKSILLAKLDGSTVGFLGPRDRWHWVSSFKAEGSEVWYRKNKYE